MPQLPAFPTICAQTERAVSDVQHVARSDWDEGCWPTHEQGEAFRRARRALAEAAAAFKEAAR